MADENGTLNSVTVKVVKKPCCIKIKLDGNKFLALVSTGNGYSSMRKKVFEELKLELDEEKEELVSVSLGPPLQAIGSKTICIQIGNVFVSHKFFVVKSLIEDFLIGGDIIFGKFGGMILRNRFWTQRITLGTD